MPSVDRVKFYRDVYCVVKEIPEGKVISYGGIARLTGWPGHSRMVGKALSQIPGEWKIPSHRVVNSQGRLVPHWSGQRDLLEAEGVYFKSNGYVDMKRSMWKWEVE